MGQPLGVVVADTEVNAERAAALVVVDYCDIGAPIITLDQAGSPTEDVVAHLPGGLLRLHRPLVPAPPVRPRPSCVPARLRRPLPLAVSTTMCLICSSSVIPHAVTSQRQCMLHPTS